jgi:hypothetical protein
MKDYGLVEVQLHAFIRFAIYGGEQLIHSLATSSPDKNAKVWAGKMPYLVQTLGNRQNSYPDGLISQLCSPQLSHYTN